jgi:hypothetical protein
MWPLLAGWAAPLFHDGCDFVFVLISCYIACGHFLSTCTLIYILSLYFIAQLGLELSRTEVWSGGGARASDKICMMMTRLACNRAIESSYWRMDNDLDVGLLLGYVLYWLPVELEFMDLDTFPH